MRNATQNLAKTISLQELADELGGKVWQKGDLLRIYFDTDRTAKAYLDFDFDSPARQGKAEIDEAGYIVGAGLYVFSNCEKQGSRWNLNRKKQIKFELMQKISAFTGCEICDSWEEVL